ncbi:MAG: hypothetical protein ACYDAG_14890 [Chloroflexota bacterium]
MATVYVLSAKGDQRVRWDREGVATADPEALAAVAEAEALFVRERRRGSAAFKLLPGEPAERIEAFDHAADEIVIVPRMAGGA